MIQEIPAKEPNIGYALFQAVGKKKKKVIGEKAYYKRYSENTLKENFILKEDETFH